MISRAPVALFSALCSSSVALAQTNRDVEPNDTAATAALAPLTPGQFFEGRSTGTVIGTGGSNSQDFYRVQISGLPATGIQRNRLTISTSGASGHVGALIAKVVANGVETSDFQSFQLSSINTSPSRMLQFYTLGTPTAEVVMRVTGTANTTSNYAVTLTTDPVTPTAGPSGLYAGNVTITTSGTSHGNDTYMVLYNPVTFQPIAWSNDTGASGSATINTTLAAGNYLLAIGLMTTVSNLLPAPTEPTGNGLINPGSNFLASSGSASTADLSFRVSGDSYVGLPLETSAATLVPASRTGPYGVAFVTLTFRCAGDIAGPNQASGADGLKTADDIIVFLSRFFAPLPAGYTPTPRGLFVDVTGPNQSTIPDGIATADDIIAFLSAFFFDC